MKILITILILFAVAMIGFNASMLNFDNLYEGDSLIAVIGIIASLCATLILTIFYLSKKIQKKIKDKE